MGIELMAVAGILLLGGGLTILIINLRRPQGVATLDQIGTYGYVAESAGGAEDGAASSSSRLARRTPRRHAPRAGFGRFSEAEVRAKLVSAGMYGTTPRKILGYQILGAIFFTMTRAVGNSASRLLLRARRSWARSAGGTIGWFLPMVYVDRTTRQRFEKIDRQMPDMIDLLVVTIEAGLGILASMRVASERLQDPLGQELRLTLQEQRMGLSVFEAITSLGQRADTPNMRMFVRALTQGEKLGVSIATTMRNLASEMRKRRKAQVEEKAQKMPIKLLFPLVFLIFPAIMIVLLVPAMIHISEVL